MTTQLLFVHALSPLHAGTGQSVGAIELAVARDRATGFPYLPGSSLKGSLRDRCQQDEAARVQAIFGPETVNASDHAGSLVFGDANLLLLPVRSLAGTFAWATSPYLLSRFARDAVEGGLAQMAQGLATAQPALGQCLVTSTTTLAVERGARVIFEDLDFTASRGGADAVADTLAPLLFPGDDEWQRGLRQRLCVVHDDVMAFLSQHATDVVARVKLKDQSKTVDHLWHEESLPVETILVSLLCAVPNDRAGISAGEIFQTVGQLVARPMQLGGKATVGRGRCRLVLAGARATAAAGGPGAPRAPQRPARGPQAPGGRR